MLRRATRARIRPARLADAEAIARVHVHAWRASYDGLVDGEYLKALSVDERAAMWRGILERGASHVFVAEAAGETVGFAAGGPSRWADLPYDAELYALYLLEGHQRKGIGRRLLATLAESLRDGGFTGLVTWILARHPVTRFYEHLGGEPRGRRDEMMVGIFLEERAYGWSDLRVLLPA